MHEVGQRLAPYDNKVHVCQALLLGCDAALSLKRCSQGASRRRTVRRRAHDKIGV